MRAVAGVKHSCWFISFLSDY